MARKTTIKRRKTYLRQWRDHRGLTQAAVVSRIIELAGEGVEDDPSMRVPKTEASLSRIENGKQPYNEAILAVLSEVYDAEPDWLLARDPSKEGKVLSIIHHLSPSDMDRAGAVLEAMFRTGTAG